MSKNIIVDTQYYVKRSIILDLNQVSRQTLVIIRRQRAKNNE